MKISRTILCLSLLLLFSIVYTTDSSKCRVLALEGGGDKGAYQAGAINGLTTYLPKNESQWDVITGVSIGSINAGFLAFFEKGNETAGSYELIDHWRNISGSNIYQNWPYLGPLYGLFYKSGLFDTSVGQSYLNRTLERFGGKLKKDVFFSATNVKTASFDSFTNSDFESVNDISEAMLSSAAFPVMFPLKTFKNNTYMDGGVKYNLDISSGVNACEKKGFEQKDIIVDIVLCSNSTLSSDNPNNLSPIGSFMRYFEISAFSSSMGVIEDAKRYMQNVTLRYLVAPTKPLPSALIPLSFDPSDIEIMINYGEEDAKNVVLKGPTTHLENLRSRIVEAKKKQYASHYIPKSKEIKKNLK